MTELNPQGWGESADHYAGRLGLPKGPDDIEGIIRFRQRTFRENNAFPPDSPLSDEEKRAIIDELPMVGTPSSIMGRLAIFARGEMQCIDLARTEHTDWQESRELDEEIERVLGEIHDDPDLQRRLNLVMRGGVIDKASAAAKAESYPTRLDTDEEPFPRGIHITRQRRVAYMALRASGLRILVRKRSDFVLNEDKAPEELAMRARVLSRGGYSLDFGSASGLGMTELDTLNLSLRRKFMALVESAISARADSLEPFAMNYYVAVQKPKR